MMFTKQLLSFGKIGALSSGRNRCGSSKIVTSEFAREFSTKKSNKGKKTTTKITVTANNEFVEHQLNSSISAHLRRQQKIHDYMQEEDRKLFVQNKINNQQKSFEQSGHKHFNKEFSKHHSKNYNKNSTQNHEYKNYIVDDKHSADSRKRANFRDQTSLLSNEKYTDQDDFSENDSDDFGIEELVAPNWDEMKLVKINKNFYAASEVTQNRNTKEIIAFRSQKHIKIDSNGLKPIFKFNELNDLSENMIAEIERLRFVECKPIQSYGIPLALSGVDVLAVSQSGTGKTLAMILSAIIHILKQVPAEPGDGPVGVILAPTQEMAEEIRQLASNICKEADIKYARLADMIDQSSQNSKPNEIAPLLISTPDCLYENLRTKSLTLKRCSYFAVYEADKMIDMCMEEEILQIASQIRPECQRLIWSQSWNGDLKELAMDLLNEYVRLDIGSSAIKTAITENIRQIIKLSEDKSKENVLNEIVDSIVSETQKLNRKTIIFTESPENADSVAYILQKRGFQCKSLHNNKSMLQRDEIFCAFQNEKIQCLVLTDVAAKNLHFSHISNVVHFDMPFTIYDYVQRVNRIECLDGVGISHAIVTEEDGHMIDDLIAILQQCKQSIDPALFILKAANADSDDEISFAVPKDKGFKKYTIDKSKK